MSLYVRVFTAFYNHRKTIKLRALIGESAYWLPPRLWAYAAENQPDGDFSDYTEEQLAIALGYTGVNAPSNAPSMLQAMLQAGFLDADRKIHDWQEHNAYHQRFAEKARNAAKARWGAEKAANPLKGKEIERKGAKHCSKHAPSIATKTSQISPLSTAQVIDLRRNRNILTEKIDAYHPPEQWEWDSDPEAAGAKVEEYKAWIRQREEGDRQLLALT